ncbi:hypothetical protein [Rubellicoccus peritrichatus]|uniref:Methyltransferase n=1 Tax=Rubellicoccus peritrichatus TaxID=3080537 RepID=A0AAQ3L6N8_9BACT|nr:hypothetical protein [Puniceicoccus sp. CR14]WOO39657.1 hypothetical protein RZN69_13620 [Puniceicoccus sp. CR14]
MNKAKVLLATGLALGTATVANAQTDLSGITSGISTEQAVIVAAALTVGAGALGLFAIRYGSGWLKGFFSKMAR